LHVRIDRRRKFPATILLKALGYSTNELLRYFYKTETITLEKKKCWRDAKIENLYQKKITEDMVKGIHGIILKGINDDYAGRYRNVNVSITGAGGWSL